MTPERVVQRPNFRGGTLPMEVENGVVPMPCAERCHPYVEHDQADHEASRNGGCKFQRATGHANDDDRQDEGGVQRVPEDIAKPHDGKNGHQPKGCHQVVGQHKHHHRHERGDHHEGIHIGPGIGQAGVREHINPGDGMAANEGEQQPHEHHGDIGGNRGVITL